LLGNLSALGQQNWGLFSAGIIIVAIALFYRGFENSKVSSREIAVIAVLGAVAALGRVPFAALPSIQPTTFLVVTSGLVFGSRAGFMVGATAALVSNFFLGQGPWTPWQMFAWGLAGFTAGLLKKLFPGTGRRGTLFFLAAWGYGFGWIIDFWFWTAFISPLNLHSFIATCATTFGLDTMHAAGNVLFYLAFGTGTVKVLRRVKKKIAVSSLQAETFQ
jgi:energy-coupling factor transport system substrate-specific component